MDSWTHGFREPECQMAGIGGEGGIRTLGTAKTVRRLSKPVQSTTLPPLRTRSADMTGSHPLDPNMWGPSGSGIPILNDCRVSSSTLMMSGPDRVFFDTERFVHDRLGMLLNVYAVHK